MHLFGLAGTRPRARGPRRADHRPEHHRIVQTDGQGRAKYFGELQLTAGAEAVARQDLEEVRSRLQFLDEVGLEYLTLDRLTSTLSGGESQRIQLATSLGSHLVGALYVLDEPSIGLHPRDTGG